MKEGFGKGVILPPLSVSIFLYFLESSFDELNIPLWFKLSIIAAISLGFFLFWIKKDEKPHNDSSQKKQNFKNQKSNNDAAIDGKNSISEKIKPLKDYKLNNDEVFVLKTLIKNYSPEHSGCDLNDLKMNVGIRIFEYGKFCYLVDDLQMKGLISTNVDFSSRKKYSYVTQNGYNLLKTEGHSI